MGAPSHHHNLIALSPCERLLQQAPNSGTVMNLHGSRERNSLHLVNPEGAKKVVLRIKSG